MKEALLIIDVQNDYFPGGANELAHPFEAEKWTDGRWKNDNRKVYR